MAVSSTKVVCSSLNAKQIDSFGFFWLNDRIGERFLHDNEDIFKKEAEKLLASFGCRYSLKSLRFIEMLRNFH